MSLEKLIKIRCYQNLEIAPFMILRKEKYKLEVLNALEKN